MSETGSRAGARTGMPRRARPIIAVSHQHGARGSAIARLVAERMGYALWDRELVGAIAAKVRMEPAQIAALDERCHAPGASANAAGAPGSPGRADYLRGLELVAHSIARRGSAVVVGRGVGFLIDETERLHVRVVCPLERRIAGVMERAKLSRESAQATIAYVDRERRAFVEELHGRDLDDPATFDLVLSTCTLTLEGAADVIITAYHARFDLHRWPSATIAPPVRETRPLADDRR